MDFLGLRNLTILEKTLEIIERRKAKKIVLESIPINDPETFTLLSKGETIGVFQLESSGMTRYLKELQPTQFGDLVAMVSLYRPGPMKFIPDYINGKHGKKQIAYPHPSLEKVLSPTFGIAVYQEQILEVAKIFGGFTLGEADLLRRAIGKKIASELAAQRQKFIDGAKFQGYEEALAIKIFDEIIEPFAGYGFNKSHAACYALIAYQTAYLKAHYPVEFIAALLSCDQENTDRVILDIEASRKMGISVLPPSVMESDDTFTVVDEKTIRFGLSAIKGIGESVVFKILEARKQKPFLSFDDFLARSGQKAINKKSLEALGKSGALLCFEKTENILANIDFLLDFSKSQDAKVDIAQDDLFGNMGIEIDSHNLKLQQVAPLHLAERLRMEKEVLGMYVSDHPLRGMSPYFEKKGVIIRNIAEAMRFSKEKKITLQGLVTNIRKITTKKKEAMAIITIEDLSGSVEGVFFPKSYEKIKEEIREDSFASISGKAEKRDGIWQIIGDTFLSRSLEEVRDEAEKENLMNDDSPFGILPEEQEEAEAFFEEEGEEAFLAEQTSSEIEKPKGETWTIILPENTKKSSLNDIKEALKLSHGNDTVIFSLHGHEHVFKQKVDATKEVREKVEKLLKA
jgi:DNA polymerase III subunit alpha